MIQGLDLFADLQRNCRESCAQAVAKEQVSMEAIAHIAPLHTFAASREPGNNKTLLFLAGIIPTWPCIYHWLPPRSLTQLPFTCNLSASQQHKSDNDNPAKEKRGSPESFAQIVYYPPNITMCRWNNLDQTPYYIYISIYDIWYVMCVYMLRSPGRRCDLWLRGANRGTSLSPRARFPQHATTTLAPRPPMWPALWCCPPVFSRKRSEHLDLDGVLGCFWYWMAALNKNPQET
jgi:hypothetical protein